MENLVDYLEKNIQIASLIINVALVVFTIGTIVVAIFAFRAQLKAITLNRWATLKSVESQLFVLEKEINIRLVSERDESIKIVLQDERGRINSEKRKLNTSLQKIEKKLKLD